MACGAFITVPSAVLILAITSAAEPRHFSAQGRADSQVLSSAGELLDHVCANDLHEDGERRYLELLDSAAKR